MCSRLTLYRPRVVPTLQQQIMCDNRNMTTMHTYIEYFITELSTAVYSLQKKI